MNPKVRFSLRWKITLPFMLLALVLALLLAYLLNQLLSQGDRDLFVRQLADRGQQTVDAVARTEINLLEVERLVANTEGVTEAIVGGDAEDLRARVLPVVINAGVDVVAVLDSQGTSLLALRRAPEAPPGDYSALRGESFYIEWPFVGRLLRGEVDEGIGDKQAGLHSIRLDNRDLYVFFVGGPVLEADGRVIAAVLVGTYLDSLVPQLSTEAGANISIYDSLGGQLLASSLETDNPAALTLSADQLNGGLGLAGAGSPVRAIQVSATSYREVLLPLDARQGTALLGVLGVSLLDAPVQASAQANALTVVQFGAVALVLVVATGLLISNSITRPLVEIAEASAQVATGNLETRVREAGSDEIGVLARSFNYMVEGLRQGSYYRDLAGSLTPPPTSSAPSEQRPEQRTLARGHSALATVLSADLRGMLPPEVQSDAQEALTTLTDHVVAVPAIVARHGGEVIRFDGQSLTALFGVLPQPSRPPVSALQAVHAGVAILEHARSLSAGRQSKGQSGVRVSIGIATGPVVAGPAGDPDRPALAVIGEAADEAYELALLDRGAEGGGMLIGAETHRSLGEARRQFTFGASGPAMLQGLGRQVLAHAVTGRTTRLVS